MKRIMVVLALGLGWAMQGQAVNIDGNFSDWTTTQRIGLDAPGEVSAGDVVDWRTLWATFETNSLRLSYETQASIDFAGNAWRYGIYVDTDNQSGTGFRGGSSQFACGAEYYVEGASVYQYTGDGTSWSWNYAGSATYAIGGTRLEMSIPASLLGITAGSRLKLMLFGNNPTTVDYAREDRAGFPYPADAQRVDADFSDWNSVVVSGTDAVNDVSGGDVVNWQRLRVRGTNGTLYINYDTAATIDFAANAWRYDLYVDSDNDNRTGYRNLPGGSGVEHLIEGGTLYRYTGSGTDWSWASAASLNYAISTTRLELAVAASHLQLATNYALRIRLYGNNATSVDYAPHFSPGFYYATATQGAVRCQAMTIPAYFYPGSLWNQAVAGAPRVEIMVMNPMNGPGSAIDPMYAAAVSNARAAGILVAGYVYTGYGTRNTNTVMADIATYEAWYNVDGIFLDETASAATNVAYYRAIDDYIRSFPSNLTILNPGIYPDESYMGAGDIILSFEGTYAAYNSSSYTIPAWARSYSPWRFWHAVYATSSQTRMNTAVNKSRNLNAAYLYVTQDTVPNPWDTLPTYWSAELVKLGELCP